MLKLELNSLQPLTIITKRTILDVAAVPDPRLCVTGVLQICSNLKKVINTRGNLVVKPRFFVTLIKHTVLEEIVVEEEVAKLRIILHLKVEFKDARIKCCVQLNF